MRGYFYLAKLRLYTQFAYRIEAFAGILGSLLSVVCAVFLWKTAFRNTSSAAGVTQEQMIIYAVLAVALKDVFHCSTQDHILARVRSGDIALDLARPCNPLLRYLVEDVAMSITTFFRRLLPLTVAASFVFLPLAPVSIPAALLASISGIFSFVILWCLSALVGMIAFWFLDLGNMGFAKDALVRLLSGSIVPIWFFPDWYRPISRYLPFEHAYQTMLGIYVGKTPFAESLKLVGIQAFWSSILSLAVVVVWNRAKDRVLIQGG
jgi:ABC-2 type transport system permease protein